MSLRRALAPVLVLLVALCLAPWSAVWAQEAMVRTSLTGTDSVWVGQRITLVVDLLVPGYFASAASFDLPDPDGVLLLPPVGHPMLGNETIDGTTYTVQRHQLAAWPMRAGDQAIPALTVRVSFKRNPLDSDTVAVSLTTAPSRFAVKLPPGAEQLGTVISARNLRVEDAWSPEPGPDDIRAGAAFTRTITFTAPDVPGMVFPPFPADPVDGLGVYAKRQVLDHTDRGSLTGVRRDVVTYVCQQPGQVVIPAVRFTWFDLDSRQLRTERLQARTLTVVANPDMAGTDATATGADRSRAPGFEGRVLRVTAAALGIIVLGWIGWRSSVVRALLTRSAAPFRAVVLQPLNPTEVAAGKRSTDS